MEFNQLVLNTHARLDSESIHGASYEQLLEEIKVFLDSRRSLPMWLFCFVFVLCVGGGGGNGGPNEFSNHGSSVQQDPPVAATNWSIVAAAIAEHG